MPYKDPEKRRIWYNPEKAKEYQNSFKENNPDWQRKKRNADLKRKYGITIDEYDRLVQEQHNTCPICHKDFLLGQRPADVDHCHKTGNVRGILHSKCNQLLAYAEDSPDTLRNAINYLKEHNG